MHKSRRPALLFVAGVAAFAVASLGQPAQAGAASDIVRVSVASNEAGGGLRSWSSSISSDGRFVAFDSGSPNLVAGDSGDGFDVFVRDRRTGTTELVSVGLDGAPAGASSPAISADGDLVAFVSGSPQLVAGDSTAEGVFVRNRELDVTERLMTVPVEAEANWSVSAPSMSADGRYVAYSTTRSTWNSRQGDVFVHDRLLDTTQRVGGLDEARGHDFLTAPTISADGNVVAYRTYERHGFRGAEQSDSAVLVHERTTGRTEDVDGDAVDPEDSYSFSEPPSLSGDGRFVAFASGSDGLVAEDHDGVVDAFVHDRSTGRVERITASPSSPEGGYVLNPVLSLDGRYVAYEAPGTSLSGEVYVHDRATGATRLISGGDPTYSDADSPVFAGEGRYLAFVWDAPNLDRWDTNRDEDVFVQDLLGGPDAFDRADDGTVPCPDATSASVTCTVDRKGRTVFDGSWYDEAMAGTGGADVMRGGRGSDFITGRRGADMMNGGPGRDALLGGGGVDRLTGGSGPDWMRGGSSRDAFFGGRGADRIDAGGQRREVVDCGAGADDRVRGARADRVRTDCEDVRKGGGYAITDANAYGGGW